MQLKQFREISTTLFMETKIMLKSQVPETSSIRTKVDQILNTKFANLGNSEE